jgi:hypothetical protein
MSNQRGRKQIGNIQVIEKDPKTQVLPYIGNSYQELNAY